MNTAPHAPELAASIFIKACESYVEACRVVCERLSDPLAQAMALPGTGFEAWQQLAKSLGIAATGPAISNWDELLSHVAPGLGATREYQGILQRLSQIGARFQHGSAEMARQGTQIAEAALQGVRQRATREPVLATQAAAAYEAWIECAESAYAQAAHSDTFARSLGELCNLISAFKVERGKLLDALARHLDLPSRSEIDDLHRRVRELEAVRKTGGSTPR